MQSDMLSWLLYANENHGLKDNFIINILHKLANKLNKRVQGEKNG